MDENEGELVLGDAELDGLLGDGEDWLGLYEEGKAEGDEEDDKDAPS